MPHEYNIGYISSARVCCVPINIELSLSLKLHPSKGMCAD